jgi:carboxypeptidase family protein
MRVSRTESSWWGAGRWAALALVAAFALGCGGGGEEAQEEGAPADEAAQPVPADSAATITGSITFEGTPPPAEPIDMSEEPTCAEKHSEPPAKHAAVVGAAGELANVYVYVKEGLAPRNWGTPSEGLTIDQNGCEYHPHVLAIQVGQPLNIKNSDGILHNINTQPTVNQGFNISQPVEMETERTFTDAEVMIPVKCDVHGWMEAYIGVQDHPFAAVSGEDGTFSLAGLPPGTYTIEAWHERYGTQTQSVTVGPQESAEISFTFSSGTANAVPLGEPIDLHDHGAEQPRHDAAHAPASANTRR